MRRFAAALALVIAATAAAPARASDSARPLRVVTFNLFHGGPASGLTGDTRDLDTRLATVIEELRRLAPDVQGSHVVCDSRVILDRPVRRSDGRPLWPSDHYGVLAELAFFGIQCAP
jgi:hypothetical protein